MAESDGQVVFTVELDDAGFQAGMVRLQSALNTLEQTVTAALRTSAALGGEALTAGAQWVQSYALGASRNKAAANALRNVVSTATAAARQTGYSGGFSLGQNIVAGIESGARNRSGFLNTALAGIVQSALEAARKAGGIESPSKLFRDEVGNYLALGVESGFVDTMRRRVLPAISLGMADSAAAGKQALENTLLAGVWQTVAAQTALPETAMLNAATFRSAALDSPKAALATEGGQRSVQVNQYVTFESTMQAPDEIARAIRKNNTYGLAGARV